MSDARFIKTIRTSCAFCTFFERPRPNEAIGVCHKNPPPPLAYGTVSDRNGQPMPLVDTFLSKVPDTHWCGGFQSAQQDFRSLSADELGTAAAEGQA
jgi:hypothetical protein